MKRLAKLIVAGALGLLCITCLSPAAVASPATPPPPAAAAAEVPPMPTGAGYWCAVSRDRERYIDCTHISLGTRWGEAKQSSGCSLGTWTVCVQEKPDMSLLGTLCDIGLGYKPECVEERRTGVKILNDRKGSYQDTLWAKESLSGRPSGLLHKDEWMISRNQRYGLVFQADGNLVAYAPDYRVLWHSKTYGNPGANFVFQSDGNAVIYAPDGRALWHSGTWGNPGATLRVQDDGNVVVYRPDGSAAFDTGWDR